MRKKIILVSVVVAIIALLFIPNTVAGPMPLWLSIMPPLIAIVMALLLKEVLSSLFLGILSGTFIMALYAGNSPTESLLGGVLRVADTYMAGSLFDADHVKIIIFTVFIGGVVRVITVNGGMKSVVNWLAKRAKTSRSAQLMTFLMDLCIFFDDYSNTLVVGNTMRPVTDKMRVSREKLSYIVDSTSAPVVSIAFVTTWIGAELSYIQQGIDTIGLDTSAYSVFFNSLAYSFYPILTLAFVLMIVFFRRDYGPMFKAEVAARKSMEINIENDKADDDSHGHILDAFLPLLILVLGTIAGLMYIGFDAAVWSDHNMSFFSKISATIGNSNSYLALIWSSLISLLTAIFITMLRGKIKFVKLMEEVVEGFKSMFNAIVILTMAWSIALITKDMHTAEFVSQILLDMSLSPVVVPIFTFVIACLIGFSTGTSWGTMAILYPLILPASWMLCQKEGLSTADSMPLFYNVVASVMAGAVMGDHCSPISDTTIMSSLASGCDHLRHVATQFPYALTVGIVALLSGIIPTAFGVPSWLAFLASFVILALIVRFIGKKVPDYNGVKKNIEI
ncbi:MAG: Na+/H+ antiporter NhaC family protein [Bacteroidales bacterium]|nr:Na+/H+ antiporter NhaC family protein [Bacteroidales bacterium]